MGFLRFVANEILLYSELEGDTMTGFYSLYFKDLVSKLNINYNVTFVHNGWENEVPQSVNETSRGSIASLLRNESDFFLIPTICDYDVFTAFECTQIMYLTEMDLLSTPQKTRADIFRTTLVFQKQVWLCLFLFIVLIPITWTSIKHYFLNRGFSMRILLTCAFETFARLLGQDTQIGAKDKRYFWSTLTLGFFFIMMAYNSVLLSFMAYPSGDVICDSYLDVLRYPKMLILAIRRTPTAKYLEKLEEINPEAYKNLPKQMYFGKTANELIQVGMDKSLEVVIAVNKLHFGMTSSYLGLCDERIANVYLSHKSHQTYHYSYVFQKRIDKGIKKKIQWITTSLIEGNCYKRKLAEPYPGAEACIDLYSYKGKPLEEINAHHIFLPLLCYSIGISLAVFLHFYILFSKWEL